MRAKRTFITLLLLMVYSLTGVHAVSHICNNHIVGIEKGCCSDHCEDHQPGSYAHNHNHNHTTNQHCLITGEHTPPVDQNVLFGLPLFVYCEAIIDYVFIAPQVNEYKIYSYLSIYDSIQLSSISLRAPPAV